MHFVSLYVNIMIGVIASYHYYHPSFFLLLPWCTIMCHMSPYVNTMVVINTGYHYYYLFFTTTIMMYHCASYVFICQYYGCYYYRLPLLLFVIHYYHYGVPLHVICDRLSILWLLLLYTTIIAIICFFMTIIMMHHYALYVSICQQHGCYYYKSKIVLFVFS